MFIVACSGVLCEWWWCDDVDGMRLRLWTAATNRPIVYPLGDTWAWITMVKWFWQRKTPDSFTRALWYSYQQSHLVASRRNRQREWWIWPCKVFLLILASDLLTCRKILWHEASLLPLQRKACCRFLFPLKIHPLAGIEPVNLWSNGKHANYYTT
jgi:hypothetical protein